VSPNIHKSNEVIAKRPLPAAMAASGTCTKKETQREAYLQPPGTEAPRCNERASEYDKPCGWGRSGIGNCLRGVSFLPETKL